MGRLKKVYTEKHCANPDCEKEFMPTREWQRYCNKGCRLARFSEERVARLEEFTFRYQAGL
jgi:hypothetical protein